MLSVKQLCEKANISQQTFYRLIRDSKEFSALVEQNRQRKSNGYRYDTPVLEWLLAYYERENAASEPPEKEPDTSIEAERDALRVELEALQARFDAVEAERKELLAQNGQLLLLLSQEKQEKQALLPPPRIPLVERVKALFHQQQKKEQG